MCEEASWALAAAADALPSARALQQSDGRGSQNMDEGCVSRAYRLATGPRAWRRGSVGCCRAGALLQSHPGPQHSRAGYAASVQEGGNGRFAGAGTRCIAGVCARSMGQEACIDRWRHHRRAGPEKQQDKVCRNWVGDQYSGYVRPTSAPRWHARAHRGCPALVCGGARRGIEEGCMVQVGAQGRWTVLCMGRRGSWPVQDAA